MSFEPISQAGILHNYARNLSAFELNPPTVLTPDRNTLLFIGGLGEGFYTVPYVIRLAKSIEGWSVVEVLISSSYKGWGTSSLKRDAEELASCVAYFRKMRPDGRVALMGSSTGCQDAMEYVTNLPDDKPKLDGAILQAPVSDREAVVNTLPKERYLASLFFCRSWIDEGKGEEVIPIEYRSQFRDYPISAQRWYSLIAPLGHDGKPQGADDYFSSDISEEVMTAIFAKIKADTKLLFLFSGNDQFVPESVDKEALLKRWFRAAAAAGAKVDTDNSAVVAGANHTYYNVPDEVFEDFCRRVVSFLKGLETQ